MKRFLSPEVELWKDDPTLLDPRWRVFGTAGGEGRPAEGEEEGARQDEGHGGRQGVEGQRGNEGEGQGGSERCPCLTRLMPFEAQRLAKMARVGVG